jgi:hypothetical protein
MASLTTLQGRGNCRIPTAAGSLVLSQHDLHAIIRRVAAEHYPHKSYRVAIQSLQVRPDAARLICEAAVAYTTEP